METRCETQFLVQDEGLPETFEVSSSPAPIKRKRNPYIGIALATISSLFFSLSSVIVKWMVNIHPIELAAWRFVGILLPAIPIAIYRKENVFPKGKRLMLILRSFFGTTSLTLTFYSFRHMPLADASVIIFSVPVFVAIFAVIFLKEPCDVFSAFTIVLTLTGVLLIVRPVFIFGPVNDDPEKEVLSSDVGGTVAAFSSTLFAANVYIILRMLKGIHFSVIMINFGFFALIETLFLSWVLGIFCLPQCGLERILIVALGLFSFGGQICLTMSLKLEEAGPVSIARTADVVFAFIWQIIFFKQIPTFYSVLGAILISCSVILIGLKKWSLALPADSFLKKTFGYFIQ